MKKKFRTKNKIELNKKGNNMINRRMKTYIKIDLLYMSEVKN